MIKIFEGQYDKRDFYYYMGDIFSSKEMKKEMPYLCNENNRIWFLYIDEQTDTILGFSSIQVGKNKVEFRNSYVFNEYRECGIFGELYERKTKYLKDNNINKPIETAVQDHTLVDFYKKDGFEIIRKTVNYTFMRKG